MYTWLNELTFGLAGVLSSVTMATLRSENCGAVNSTAQTSIETAVIQQSKFGIKPFTQPRHGRASLLIRKAARASAASASWLLKLGQVTLKAT